jgi:hypothetical protein
MLQCLVEIYVLKKYLGLLDLDGGTLIHKAEREKERKSWWQAWTLQKTQVAMDMQIETLRIQANESGEAILPVPLLLL